MNIIFNELSTGHLAKSAEEGGEWMDKFFSAAETLETRTHKPINIQTTRQLKECLIADNYSFVEWLSTRKDRDYMRKIIKRLTHVPLASSYPYYYYQNLSCHGLGVAHQLNKISISYPSAIWNPFLKVIREAFNENEEVEEVEFGIKNITGPDDVFIHFPVRSFDHHYKHDNRRLNLNDGESTLNYQIPLESSKVQKLLDQSFGLNDYDGERLYNFDENVGLFIEFNCHKDSYYHGYHIHDNTRVPYSVKGKIAEFSKEK